jgi:hypothetical protein
MAVRTLKLAEKRYVLLPEKEYQRLRRVPNRDGGRGPA